MELGSKYISRHEPNKTARDQNLSEWASTCTPHLRLARLKLLLKHTTSPGDKFRICITCRVKSAPHDNTNTGERAHRQTPVNRRLQYSNGGSNTAACPAG